MWHMVIGHHIILTGYGHWLPNDPRGSLSREVRCLKLKGLGEFHFGRKSVQPDRIELRDFYHVAKLRLNHPLIWFDKTKRDFIAEAFAEVIRIRGYTCWACAIMSNHAHLLIRRHRDRSEQIIEQLRASSAVALRSSSMLLRQHPIWSDDAFKRYVSSVEDVLTVVQYIRENPAKSHLPRQRWGFVREYAGEWSGVQRLRR